MDTAARRTLAKEVKRACVDVGFFYGSVPTLRHHTSVRGLLYYIRFGQLKTTGFQRDP